jgi:DNA-binding CsgD family transcriptional regulator
MAQRLHMVVSVRTTRSDSTTNRARCVVLAKRGLPAVAIAKKLRMHKNSVNRHLKRAGMKAPLPKRGVLPPVDRLEALVERHGAAKIAERYKVSRQAVYKKIAKAKA